jgi:hypothetical protein
MGDWKPDQSLKLKSAYYGDYELYLWTITRRSFKRSPRAQCRTFLWNLTVERDAMKMKTVRFLAGVTEHHLDGPFATRWRQAPGSGRLGPIGEDDQDLQITGLYPNALADDRRTRRLVDRATEGHPQNAHVWLALTRPG